MGGGARKKKNYTEGDAKIRGQKKKTIAERVADKELNRNRDVESTAGRKK